jgi:hypothetical protein
MIRIHKLAVLALILTSFFGSTTSVQAVNDPNNWGYFGCTKAKVSQAGKYATWSCFGDGNAFLSKVLAQNKSLVKSKVNSRIGEVKYTQKTQSRKSILFIIEESSAIVAMFQEMVLLKIMA